MQVKHHYLIIRLIWLLLNLITTYSIILNMIRLIILKIHAIIILVRDIRSILLINNLWLTINNRLLLYKILLSLRINIHLRFFLINNFLLIKKISTL